MFPDLSSSGIIILNFVLMLAWHLIILLISISLKSSFFNPGKFFYTQRKWEKNGSFYIKKMKIKKWKDFLPQYVAKGGFSKRRLEPESKLNEKYINIFIIETCRAEWNHFMCSIYFVISFLINSFCYALVFSVIPLIVNLPFVAIQRYNRIRLKKLSQKCSRLKPSSTQEISL